MSISKLTKGKPALIVALSIAMGTLYVTPAQSQDADAIEEITVIGIQRSLSEARDIKRDSTQFLDAIVADDIGKLPDTNIAESLARVSGVQIDRGIGEGSDISIRGLRENVILYNGRQIIDGSGRGGNGLDQLGTSTYGLLATIPSELVGRLEVSKLAAANEISGGLGGTVNIISRKPLDQSGHHFAGTYKFASDQLGGDGFDAFGMYSGTNADNTFGFLLGITATERTLAEHALNTFSGYSTISGAGLTSRLFDDQGSPVSPDPNGDGVEGYVHLDPRLQQIDETRERIGVNAMLQWLPNDNLDVTLDYLQSDVESDRDRRWLGYFAGFGDYNNVQFSSNEIITSGIITRPTQTNVEFADVESGVQSTALNVTWNASDNIEIFGEISASNATGEYAQQFLRLQTLVPDNVTFDLTSGDYGTFDFGADFTDPSSLGLAIMFDQLFTTETDDFSTRFDLSWDLGSGAINSIETGIRYQTLETDTARLNVDIRGIGTDANDLGNTVELFSNPDFLPGEFGGAPRTYLSFNEAAMAAGCQTFSGLYTPAQQALCDNPESDTALLDTYRVEENFLDAYVQANFGSTWGNTPVSGNFGVRVVDRDLTSTGNQLELGVIAPDVFERTDTEVLPSAVVRFETSDDLVLRVGAARAIAFPNTEDLSNRLTLNSSDTGGSGGAPNLDPFLANQFDFSAEWYFTEDALLSAGLFYKDIDTFIITQVQDEVIDGVVRQIQRKINGDSATISGLELLYQQPLPANFGIVATYSFIDSETPIEDVNGRNLPFPGLSENNVNLILYYEVERFNTRLAYNWRDEYLQGIGPANTGVFFESYSDLSLTAQWNVNDNWTATFEALNLLDSNLKTFNAVPEALRTNAIYGEIYKLGISARF